MAAATSSAASPWCSRIWKTSCRRSLRYSEMRSPARPPQVASSGPLRICLQSRSESRSVLDEAGQGGAPIAHASAKGKEPVSEGFVAILEPFIDTIIITLTGLVILSSGVWQKFGTPSRARTSPSSREPGRTRKRRT